MRFTPAAFILFYDSQIKAEKFDYYADNKRFGMVCATIANIFSKRKYKASNFFDTEARDRQTPEEMANIFKAITIGLGGTVKE